VIVRKDNLQANAHLMQVTHALNLLGLRLDWASVGSKSAARIPMMQ